MGRGGADQNGPIEVQHRSSGNSSVGGSQELKTCSGPVGRDLYCDGFEHYLAEIVPECCGNFLATGECCGNAVPGEEITPVEECPHAAENAHLRGRPSASDEALDIPF